jgi:hypothetical protein
MKRVLLATAAAIGLFATSANAFQAAPQLAQPNLRYGKYLECAIVRHTPDRDSNPAYKVSIAFGIDEGVFQSLDVYYTLVNGREVNRSEQYVNGRTWTDMPRLKNWYWAGTRGSVAMVGNLYHNERDGWMYREQIVQNGRLTYQMLADCHEQQGE